MPSLLSGSILREGGSGEFINLPTAQPQLPASETTATGFTVVTNSLLQTSYSSSLGYIDFNQSTMRSSLSTGTIRILATGTSAVSTSTGSGTLVVEGGVGIGRNLWVKEDINVNDLTIGRGYEGENNIVFRGTATIPEYEYNNGQENIAIGFDTLAGISSAYRNIAIGRYALSSGTNISSSIAIGDSALKRLGVLNYIPVADIIGATQANPVVITAPGHGLSSGAFVNITEVVGMTELTTQSYYISVVSSSTFRLYTDLILTVPVNGTAYNGYIDSGTVNRILAKDNNIAIGVDAGASLVDGERNFFLGDQIAKNLTTGSYNFFAGRGGININSGSNIISISGSNVVDGIDNQINFGSVFYYNGLGFTNFNSNMELGLGEQSTSPTTGAVTVIGGIGATGNVNIGGTGTSISVSSGALVVEGGAGIGGSVNIGQELIVVGSGKVELSPGNRSVLIMPTGVGYVTIAPHTQGEIDNMTIGLAEPAGASFEYVSIINATASTSTTTGVLTVAGGVGIRGDVYSNTGIADENYLLYTPQVFVTTSTPVAPRLGDQWIDPSNYAYLQYIKDGTSTFWIQVGAV
jgi:hypothetical protein